MSQTHFDVIIIGAGLSGAGRRRTDLQAQCPGKSLRHPGGPRRRSGAPGTCSAIRGCAPTATCTRSATPSAPGTEAKAIADGPSILNYIRETARPEGGIERHIRFGHKVTRAPPGPRPRRCWTLEVACSDGTAHGAVHLRPVLFTCTGYYDYSRAAICRTSPARNRFGGPAGASAGSGRTDLDYRGKKRVVVIGSGATAVTLGAGHGARTAAHVTMLQRTPTYVVSRPSVDAWADKDARPPAGQARLRPDPAGATCCSAMFFFNLARKRPAKHARAAAGLPAPASRAGLRYRVPLHSAATIPGTSGFAWCRTRTCSTP